MMRCMLLRHEISYDAPLADVFAMLSDPGVPLIDGKLEPLMGDLVTSGTDKEQVAGVAWWEGKR
jgi:hypothetical protein